MRLRSGRVKLSSEDVELATEVKDDGEVVADGGENGQLLVKDPVLLPEEIMAYIAKMVDFVSLKNLRYANKSWSAAVTPELQRRTVLTLSLKQNLPSLKRMIRQTADLKGIKTIRIDMTNPVNANKSLDAKILVVNNRLQSLAPVLKTLSLENCGHSPPISVIVQSPTIRFEAITKLAVSNDGINGSLAHRLFTSLYASAPNLTELIVETLTSSVLSPLLNKNENEGSTSRNWTLAPNLSSLTVTDTWKNVIYPLLLFPQNWTSLDLKIFAGWFQDFPGTDLEELLEANKDSLVNLKLTFSPPYYDISLPETFSKLKKLELEFDRVAMKFNSLIFSKMFPALKAFSLKLTSEGEDVDLFDFVEFCDAFFPHQVFKGLKTLELDLGPYRELHEDLMENLNWASNMFPNAEVEIIGQY